MQVLIVDDDPDLQYVLQASLEQAGYSVLCAPNAQEGLRLVYEHHPALILLDVVMPHMDGFEMCRRIRTFSDVPIIFLTARDREADAVRGLNLGADDYLRKPFSLAELKARVEATLRRAHSPGSPNPIAYDDGVLQVDLEHNGVRKRGNDVGLSPKEFQLLACLVRNADQVVAHEQLLREVWGPGYEQELGYLALYIRYLRQKIEDDPSNPRYIRTRFRVGYYFNTEPESEPPDTTEI